MKRFFLAGITAITVSFANTSFATFSLHSNDYDMCQHIEGQWLGSGTLSNWLIGECIYRGVGQIKIIDNSGHFILNMNVEKKSGSRFCTDSIAEQFSGNCTNGVVTIITDYGDLEGSFSEQSGSAQGTLSIAPGMSAKLNISFQHMG